MDSETSHSQDQLDAIGDFCDIAGAWRDGELLVITRGAALPHRCIVTNEPVSAYITTHLYWHRLGWYLALPFTPGIYVTYLLVFANAMDVTYALSRRVVHRRRLAVVGAWCIFAIGLITASTANQASHGLLADAGLALMFAGLAVWILGTRMVRAARIDSGFAWIRGAHPEYLHHLPTWPGSVQQARPADA